MVIMKMRYSVGGYMNRQIRIEAIIVILLLLIFTVFKAQAAEKTIGVIMSSDIPYYRTIHKAFTEELALKGIKAEIVVQTPAPETMAWANAARKFGAIGTDVIVTYGSPVTQAVLSETSNIPVIFAGVYDSKALDMKHKKVTGVTSKVSIAGLLKNLKEIYNFSTLGIIYNSAEKNTLREMTDVELLGGQFSFKSIRFNVRERGDISKIKGVDAIIITTSCMAMIHMDEIVRVARKEKIPTAAIIGGAEEKGVVLTLSADPKEQGKGVADILSEIIGGKSPSDIPVEVPKKIQLIVNLKEANALGLKVSFDLLSSATRVIR